MNILSPHYESFPSQDFHKIALDAYKKNTGALQFKNLPDGIQIKMPVAGIIEINPKQIQSNDKLVLMCGVHGNERQGILICDIIISSIAKGEINPIQPISIIYANPESIELNQRTMQDGTNMNRIAHKTKNARVNNIREALDGTNTLYDLHSSFNNPNNSFSITYLFGSEQNQPTQVQHHLLQTRRLATQVIQKRLEENNKAITFPGMARQQLGVACAHTIEIGSIGQESNESAVIDKCLQALLHKIEEQPCHSTNPDQRDRYTLLGDILQKDLPEDNSIQKNSFDNISDFSYVPDHIRQEMSGETQNLINSCLKAQILFAKKEQGGERSGVLIKKI